MNPSREASRSRAERSLRQLLEPSTAATRRIVRASLSPPQRSRPGGRVSALTAAALALLLVAVAYLLPQRPPSPAESSQPSSEPVPTVTVLGTGSTIVISPSPQSLRPPEPADAAGEASGSLLLIRRRNS